jgi:hypothetical protein
MNANETTGIRELTAQELDEVTGGSTMEYNWFESTRLAISITAIGGAVLGLIDWLFG